MSESITDDATQGALESETAPQPATEVVPDPGTEQASPETTEPAKEPDPEQKPKVTPWFQKRIDELTREKHEARRQVDAMAETLRKIQQGEQPQQPQTPQPPAGYVPASEVRTEAAKIVEAERFTDACNDIYNAGVSKHPDFDEAVRNFGMLGGTPQPFLEAVTALGKDVGAKVFYDLGKNPDEASRIMGLPPVKMAMEIAKRASAPPPAIPVSKVPPPITPITGNSVREGAEPDGKDIKAWAVWFNKQRSR